MMSQIHCKQSIRIEKSGWFKHYFPGNLRRNILFKVCNCMRFVIFCLNLRFVTGLHAQTQCLPCPPLFHGRTGWAERFFVGFGNWYSYKP